MKKRPKRFGITWTKSITRNLLVVGVINGMAPFFLSMFDKELVLKWVSHG